MITLLLSLFAIVLVGWTAVWFISPIAPAEELPLDYSVEREQQASFIDWAEQNPNAAPRVLIERWYGRDHAQTDSE